MQLEVKSLEIAAKQSWRIQHLKPRERENPQPIQKKKENITWQKSSLIKHNSKTSCNTFLLEKKGIVKSHTTQCDWERSWEMFRLVSDQIYILDNHHKSSLSMCSLT